MSRRERLFLILLLLGAAYCTGVEVRARDLLDRAELTYSGCICE